MFCQGNETNYYFYALSDSRTNINLPTGSGMNQNLTDSVIVYNGLTFTNLGSGQSNLEGDVSSVGLITTINNGVITNSMFGQLILDSNLATISTQGKVQDSATSANVSSIPNTIVKRNSNSSISVNGIFFNDSGSTPLSSYAEYVFIFDVDDPNGLQIGNTTLRAVRNGNIVCIYIDQINYTATVSGVLSLGLNYSASNYPQNLKTTQRNVRYFTNINLLIGSGTLEIGTSIFRSDTGVIVFYSTANSGFSSGFSYVINPMDFCFVTT